MIAEIAGMAFLMILFLVLIEICMGGPITRHILHRLGVRFKDRNGQDEPGERE